MDLIIYSWKCNLYIERNIYSRILYSKFIKLSNHSFTKYTKLGSLDVSVSGDSEYVIYIFTSFYQDGACRRPHPLIYKDSSIWVSLRTVYCVMYWCPGCLLVNPPGPAPIRYVMATNFHYA